MIHYLTTKKIRYINLYADLSFKICSKEEYTAMVDLSNMIGIEAKTIEEGMTAVYGDGTLVVYSDGEIVLSDFVENEEDDCDFSHTFFTTIDLRGTNTSGLKCMRYMFNRCHAKKIYIDRIDYRKVDLSFMLSGFEGEIITDDIGIKQYMKIRDIRAEIMNKIRLLAQTRCVEFWYDDEKDKQLFEYFDSERKKFEEIKSDICLRKENFESIVFSGYERVGLEENMFSVRYCAWNLKSINIDCITRKRELMELWLYDFAFSKIDLTDLSKFESGVIIVNSGMLYVDDNFNETNLEMRDVKQSVIDKATENRNRLLSGVNDVNV